MSDVQVGTLASCYTVELLKIKELSSFQGLYCTMYNMLYLKNVELIWSCVFWNQLTAVVGD